MVLLGRHRQRALRRSSSPFSHISKATTYDNCRQLICKAFGTKRPWNLRQFGMFPAYPKLIAIALSSGPLARTRIGEQMVAAHDELIRILHASSIPTVEESSTPPREGTVMRFSAEIILILFVACSAA